MPRRRTVDVRVTADPRALGRARKRAARCRLPHDELWRRLDAGERLDWDAKVERALRLDPGLSEALVARLSDRGIALDSRWRGLQLAEETVCIDDPVRVCGLYEALLSSSTPEERAELYGWFTLIPKRLHPVIAADLHCEHAPTVREALRRLGAGLSVEQLVGLEAHPDPGVAELASQLRFLLAPRFEEVQAAATALLSTEDLRVATARVETLIPLADDPRFARDVVRALAEFCAARLESAAELHLLYCDTWRWPVWLAADALAQRQQLPVALEAALLALEPNPTLCLHRAGALSRVLRLGLSVVLDEAQTPDSVLKAMLSEVLERRPEDRGRILQYLSEVTWEGTGRWFAIWVVDALGAEGRALLRARSGGTSPTYRDIESHSCITLGTRLEALGAIEAGWQSRLGEGAARTMVGSCAFATVLEAVGRALDFDQETGRIPPHDALLVRLARLSAGAVVPEAALERDSGYESLVEFICQGQLYSFAPEPSGDFYDIDAVVEALNVVLRHQGSSDRFFSLPSGGQEALVVCLDETAAHTVAREFGFDLFRAD